MGGLETIYLLSKTKRSHAPDWVTTEYEFFKGLLAMDRAVPGFLNNKEKESVELALRIQGVY